MKRFKASCGTAALVVAVALLVGLLAGLAVMAGGTPSVAKAEKPWAPHLAVLEQALTDGNVTAALAAWHDAYGAARAKRTWEGMIAVGDAYLRIGDVTAAGSQAKAKARELYLTALFRARHDRSLDGVAHATEAFARLGDREVARHALRIAKDLAQAGDDADRQRVRDLAARLTSGLALAEDIPTF